MTSTSVEEPRSLEENSELRKMLDEVAANSGWSGINLHGRLLAQWLHYAFPHDCPYPAKGGSVAPLTASKWSAKAEKEGADGIDWSKAKMSRADHDRERMERENEEENTEDIIVDE